MKTKQNKKQPKLMIKHLLKQTNKIKILRKSMIKFIEIKKFVFFWMVRKQKLILRPFGGNK